MLDAHRSDLLWAARHFVYQHFVITTVPPTITETASHFGVSTEQAEQLYYELHARHALFLEPGTTTIRMANPFSGVPTQFLVTVADQTYFANCAWDALGIAAVLRGDAIVQGVCAGTHIPIQIEIRSGQVYSEDVITHFSVPFRQWYDDLIFT
jgi:hypothetical protein